jgi:putative transposase
MDPWQKPIEVKRRHLPHWTQEGGTYFVTFRLKRGELTTEEARVVLEHIKQGHGRFYELAAAVVMPDHAHIILRPNDDQTLSSVMKGIKGVSAHKVNALLGTRGQVWQDESYDRLLRDEQEYMQKLHYTLKNPLKKGLCADPMDYPGMFYNPDFE